METSTEPFSHFQLNTTGDKHVSLAGVKAGRVPPSQLPLSPHTWPSYACHPCLTALCGFAHGGATSFKQICAHMLLIKVAVMGTSQCIRGREK